jgi:hypothetical protein
MLASSKHGHKAIINQVSHELAKQGSISCILESDLGDHK